MSFTTALVVFWVAAPRLLNWVWERRLRARGALSTPPPLIDGQRTFRDDMIVEGVRLAAVASAFAVLAFVKWPDLKRMDILALLMPAACLVILFYVAANMTSRLVLDQDAIRVRWLGREWRRVPLADITNIERPSRWAGKSTSLHARNNKAVAVPPLMHGGDWLIAHVEEHAAAKVFE